MVKRVVADIAAGDKNHAADKARQHFRIKDHAHAGDEAEGKAENRYNREQRRGEAQFFGASALLIPLAAEIELA